MRIRYGYSRIHILLQREGWKINRKRVYRLCRLEGLSLRRKRPRRHVTAARRMEREVAVRPNQQWSMDFVSDALFDGRRIRALTLVDNDTREALAIVVDGGIRGEQVVQAVERIAEHRGAPERIRVDHGPEFVSKALDRWAYERVARPHSPRPSGSPEPAPSAHLTQVRPEANHHLRRAGNHTRVSSSARRYEAGWPASNCAG
ncbi:DDE-type integrase/transposase/recombinase [Teichococcus vastitatis]|uniref:DDE-type integrase/transposase/recombinase n=1 Tax=Teichococcus vastitatis TaxID=2307076 RepID=UPI0038CF7ABE